MRRPLFCIWQKDIIEQNQQKRQLALEKLELTSNKVIPIFDEATQTVADVLNCPIAMLGIVSVTQTEYILKSAYGLSNLGLMNELARTRKVSTPQSFATNVIDSCSCLLIDNTLNDSFFSQTDFSLIYGITAYIGVPLITADGVCIGCLEVMDTQSREFSPIEINYLTVTARWCLAEYERNKLVTTIATTNLITNQQSVVNDLNSAELLPTQNEVVSPSLPLQQDSHSDYDQESYLKKLIFLLLNKLIGKLSIPLTSVIGMSSVLKREIYGNLNPKQSEYIEIIYNSGQEVTNLIDEITQITNIENELKLVYAPVDLENLGKQVIASLESMADTQKQKMRLSIQPGKKVWRLDREKVKKTIYYLLISVIQSSRTGGEIQIHISQKGEQLNISCHVDHSWLGDGISLEKVNWYREILQYDEYNHLSIENSVNLIKHNNLDYDLICLLFTAYLAHIQNGNVKLLGSIESGHRFILSIPVP